LPIPAIERFKCQPLKKETPAHFVYERDEGARVLWSGV
jgi:hypothetical protein